jgi:hypothetical protein
MIKGVLVRIILLLTTMEEKCYSRLTGSNKKVRKKRRCHVKSKIVHTPKISTKIELTR